MVCTQHLCFGDVPNPLKMYQGKDCVETFVEYIEEEVKRLYATFPQQPMTELTNVLKREHKAAKSVTFASKSAMIHKTKRQEITATTRIYIEEQPITLAT